MIVSPPETTRVWAFTPKLYSTIVSMINFWKHVPRTDKRWERICENFEPNFEILTSFLGSAQPPTSFSCNEPSSLSMENGHAWKIPLLIRKRNQATVFKSCDQTYQVSILLVQSVERNHIWFCGHRIPLLWSRMTYKNGFAMTTRYSGKLFGEWHLYDWVTIAIFLYIRAANVDVMTRYKSSSS